MKNINLEPESVYKYESNLNPKYTFDSFVEGKCNHMSLAAAKEVSIKMGYFNPLYIFGESGLGKTHLLHAIGYNVLKNNPSMNVVYVTCNQYFSEFVEIFKSGDESNAFKAKYHDADVLLIDDIQCIAGKPTTMEMFVEQIDVLRDANKQVVITADRIHREFINAPKRFINRIESGLVVDLTPLDYKTSYQLAHKTAKDRNITLSEDEIKFLALNYGTTIGELYGVFNKIEFYLKKKEEIDLF